jgi:hypothetical protein
MRSIGRSVSDSSPIKVKVCGWGAIRPASIRIVEPEFPQSSTAAGCLKLPPAPVTEITRAGPSPLVATVAPSASMHAREEAGSAPVEKFEMREVPSARPASMA